jgi:hypothetical protein
LFDRMESTDFEDRVFELSDEMIPDFGFIGVTKPVKGAKELEIFINAEGKPVFRDGKGKVFKSPPKAVKADAKKAFKEEAKQIQEAAKQLKANLEVYLIVRRKWALDDWRAFFCKHPLAFGLAQSLVWGLYKGSESQGLFRIDADANLVDADAKAVKPGKGVQVGLAHPIEIPEAEREAWLAIIEKAGKPPFAQMNRPVFTVGKDLADKKLCYLFENKEVAGSTFKSRAEKRAWRRGSVVDSGEVSAYYKVYPQDQIDVFIRLSNLGVGSWDYDSNCSLKNFFFVKTGAVVTGSYTYDEPRDEDDPRLIALCDVPAIVYSETIGDLTFISHKKKK